MAQAALSSPRQSLDSPPQDDTSLEPLHTLVSATNDSEHSAESVGYLTLPYFALFVDDRAIGHPRTTCDA